MTKSGYAQNGTELLYEILEDGYLIYWDGEELPRLTQTEPNIPYPWLDYQENALIQIQELCGLTPEIPAENGETPWERVEKMLTADTKEKETELEELGRAGATAVQIGLRAGAAVSPQVGKFAKHYPVWLADEGTEEVNSIKYYPTTGMAYCCIAAIQRFSHYTPDVATNNYCSYPAPDEEGIYPYVYGMLVWPGMQVRDGSGDIYTCILTEGTYKLVYAPSAVPSIFKKE